VKFSLPSHFYAIADPIGGHDPVDLAAKLVENGARIVQLRMKDAPIRELIAASNTVAKICHNAGALFIVNDRADVASKLATLSAPGPITSDLVQFTPAARST